MAHRNARLLKYWLQLYREYRPSMWYYNAGEAPTRDILQVFAGGALLYWILDHKLNGRLYVFRFILFCTAYDELARIIHIMFLFQKYPHFAHRLETELGVENLSEKLYLENWTGWNNR